MLCEADHDLEDCNSFLQFDLQGRSKWFHNKLCYGCLNICQSKRNVNCAIANTKSDIISMCVAPVLVLHKLSNCIVKTYALLDNCSQATFM